MNANIELTPYNNRIINAMVLMLESWIENNPDKTNMEIYIKDLNVDVTIHTKPNTSEIKLKDNYITFSK